MHHVSSTWINTQPHTHTLILLFSRCTFGPVQIIIRTRSKQASKRSLWFVENLDYYSRCKQQEYRMWTRANSTISVIDEANQQNKFIPLRPKMYSTNRSIRTWTVKIMMMVFKLNLNLSDFNAKSSIQNFIFNRSVGSLFKSSEILSFLFDF